MINLLWTTKQRSGAAVNISLAEWAKRKHHSTSAVVTVTNHKTGDKEPASMVITDDFEELMDR